jgi:hypothetical protein
MSGGMLMCGSVLFLTQFGAQMKTLRKLFTSEKGSPDGIIDAKSQEPVREWGEAISEQRWSFRDPELP